MEVLDTSVANVALPHIAGSLGASQEESVWVLTSYLVANAVVLPLSATIADRIGRKRFYMTCVAVFTLSSLLCGLAQNLPMLIGFRVLQGLGGGGLATSEQSILTDTFAPAKRGMAFAIYGMAVVFAPTIGPTLGGWITDNYSWNWIFFINVPIGIISLFLTAHMVEDPPHVVKTMHESRKLPLDYIGAGLVALGLGALEVTLDKGQEDDWFSSPFIVFFAVTSGLAIVYFIVWEWRERYPILNLRLLQHRNLAVASASMLLLGAIIFSTTNLVPQYLQALLGYTAQSAGEALSLGGLTLLCLMPLVGTLVSRVDPRFLIGFGFVVSSLALIHMTGIYPGVSFSVAASYRVFQSVGFAFLFVPVSTMSYVGISPEDANQVSAMTNLMRNLGGTIGLSTLSTVLARRQQVHQNFLVAHTAPTNPLFRIRLHELAHLLSQAGVGSVQGMRQAYGNIYQTVQVQATALSYIDAIWIFAIAATLAIPTAFLFQKSPPGQAVAAE